MTSPCVGVCQLDDRRECVGCRRTIGEIVAWRTLTDAEREAVLRRVRPLIPQGNKPRPEPEPEDSSG